MNCLRRSRPLRCFLPFLLLAGQLATSFVGCTGADGGRRKVTGEISFDGEPLAGGWIYFRPLDKGPSSAAEITDGSFEIPAEKGLTAGTYKVAIEYQQPTGRTKKVYTGEEIEETKQVIPPEFNAQTKLTADIQASGANHLTFDLASDRAAGRN